MPVLATKRNNSTLQLRDPGVLDNERWVSEYETEFTWKYGATMPKVDFLRLSTPKSLKKGFVHVNDYSKLEGAYGDFKASHKRLEAHMAEVHAQMKSLHGMEKEFLQGVDKEHNAVTEMKDNVTNLTDSLGGLMAAVEQNKLMASYLKHLHKELEPEKEEELDAQVSPELAGIDNRLTSLEGQLRDLLSSVEGIASHMAVKKDVARPGSAKPRVPGLAGRVRRASATQRRVIERSAGAVASHIMRQDHYCDGCLDEVKDIGIHVSLKSMGL